MKWCLQGVRIQKGKMERKGIKFKGYDSPRLWGCYQDFEVKIPKEIGCTYR